MTASRILEGVRVLDFSRYLAGPYCASLLGFLGANVIRVEKPGGSEDRFVVPLNELGDGALFMQTGANKRSMTLSLKHSRTKELLARLVRSADVVIANILPAELSSLGLDYDSLRALRPDIILTSQTAYGHAGPWAGRGGFDAVGLALSGAMQLSGTPGHPVKLAANYVDYATAVLSAFGTLSALWHRQQTGEGQHVQASLLATALAAFNATLIEQDILQLDRQPCGNRAQTSSPSDIIATRDGHVLIHVVGQGLFARVARLIGAPEWIENPEFQTDTQRGQHRDEICGRVGVWCAERSTDEVVAAMAAAGVPCAPVLAPREALVHAQMQAMGLLGRVDHPNFASPVPIANFPLQMSGMDVAFQRRPPLIGEHTDEVLRELGYDDQAIAALHAEGAV